MVYEESIILYKNHLSSGRVIYQHMGHGSHQLPVFKRLQKDPALFACASVDTGGYGILWDGTVVKTPFDGLMAFSDATELWGLNESTLRKAISYGKLVNGIDVCKFGKQWVVSIDAMKREYGAAPKR